MKCYLNRGIVLEQAVCSLLKDYFKSLDFDERYENFRLAITNTHPFADLMFREGMNAADTFPAIVVTTQTDMKPPPLRELPPQVSKVGLDTSDLEEILRTKEKYFDRKGDEREREIAGLCAVAGKKTVEAIKGAIDRNGFCYGVSIRLYRRDSIGVEVWAENNQLKNEIYEQARLFILGDLQDGLLKKYGFFAPALFDHSVTGQRSNNYNADFDVPLTGARIEFDVDYCIEQIALDTDAGGFDEIEVEVNRYV